MFDQHMLLEDGFENVVSNGETTGFALKARLPYYRGLGLSMIEEIGISIDGVAVPRDAIRLELRERSWTLDEMTQEHGDRWNFGEIGRLVVAQSGGLAAGSHRVELSERLRISYLPFVPTTKYAKNLELRPYRV